MSTLLAFAALPALTPAEAADPGRAIDARHASYPLPCAFCNGRARWAFITNDPLLDPPRWVDACDSHMRWLRGQTAQPRPLRRRP